MHGTAGGRYRQQNTTSKIRPGVQSRVVHARRSRPPVRLSSATRLASAALALVCLTATAARADGVTPLDASPAQKKEALDGLEAGKRAVVLKNWDAAVRSLRASLDVVDSPNTRLVLARALRGAGETAEAWAEYGRAIERATALESKKASYATTAQAATAERADMERTMSFVRADVLHAPAGAQLRVGGRTVPPEAWDKPIVVSPGTIDVILVDGSGKELARQTLSVGPGEKAPVDLFLDEPVAAPPSPPTASAGPPDTPAYEPPLSPEQAQLRTYAYVAGGVGAVGLLTFTVFGILNDTTFSDLQGACHPGCPANKQGEIGTGRAEQTVANAGLGFGIAGFAVGATLFGLSVPQSTPASGAALVVAPGYLGLRGSL